MNEFTYEIYINDCLVDSTNLLGIAVMKYESACLLGVGKLRKVYSGNNFDPVLHSPCTYNPLDGGWYS